MLVGGASLDADDFWAIYRRRQAAVPEREAVAHPTAAVRASRRRPNASQGVLSHGSTVRHRLIVHLLIALALVGVILLQRSEGGALGMGGGGVGGLMTGRGRPIC